MEVYAQLPSSGEPELIHEQLADGASVLDLGAGVGRIADPLTHKGHRVVAVDDSRGMLGRIQDATTVHCRIEDLRLRDRFDAVLLASFLINTPNTRSAPGLSHHRPAPRAVRWCRPRAVASPGVVRLADHGGTYPGGARDLPGGPLTTREERLVTTLMVDDISGGILRAVVTYELGDWRWTHGWQAQRLTVRDLNTELQSADPRLDQFLTQDRTWLRATAHEQP